MYIKFEYAQNDEFVPCRDDVHIVSTITIIT